MNLKRLTVVAVAAALVIATSPTLILPAAADDQDGQCGFKNVNGKLVFLGTCPHGTSEGTTATDAPDTRPCPGRSDDGEFLMAC